MATSTETSRKWMREHPENNRRAFKRWYAENKELHYERKLAYNHSNPQGHRAQVYACKVFPERQICETEGCFELGERHHDDYNKPYKIRWLCKKHHKLLNRVDIKESIML